MAQRIRDWQDQRGETILFCGSEERVTRMRGWLREQNLQIRLSEAGSGKVSSGRGRADVIGMQDFCAAVIEKHAAAGPAMAED